jgi:DNA-binding winged helix-turn-helix (wHTH) protein
LSVHKPGTVYLTWEPVGRNTFKLESKPEWEAETRSEEHSYNYQGIERSPDEAIVQLRKKLGDNGDEPTHHLTVHGVGYKLIR